MKINGMGDKIKVDGHIGTWYIIDKAWYNGKQVYLLEHETYGDEAPSLIVDSCLNVIADEVYNGFTDLPGR